MTHPLNLSIPMGSIHQKKPSPTAINQEYSAPPMGGRRDPLAPTISAFRA
uniref:Uncharacterized protein n=1 Tax=Haemonchus contortus TaxID=6289 RepID=A0A7I4YYV4_HAECO